MSVEMVREYLKCFDLCDRVMEFEISSATVDLAAVAVGTEPARIAKSLTFYGKDGDCLMIVTAGDQKIDNSKFKAQFGCKARMMSAEDAQSFTGHAGGGVCTFALPESGVQVFLDGSLRRFDVVYPAAGSSNSAVRLSCEELERATGGATWTDVCKSREA